MNKYVFLENDYKKAIFEGRLPARMTYPFSGLRYSPYKKCGYLMQIVPNDYLIYSNNFNDVVTVLNNSTMLNIHKFQEIIINYLKREYIYLKQSWHNNLTIIDNIIGDIYSKIVWSSYISNGNAIFPNKIMNDAQMSWVFFNRRKDLGESYENQFKLFDYLAYISNPEVRGQMDKYKEDTRENVAFDTMHEALLTGNLGNTGEYK